MPEPSTPTIAQLAPPTSSTQHPFFNPDGTIKSPGTGSKKYARNKQYKKGLRIAAQVQDFLPAINAAMTASTVANAPALAQSNLDITRLFGPEFARLAAANATIGQEETARGDLALLRGTGRDITAETSALQELADPEFFNLRRLIGGKADELISGMDPNKLTEAEIANVERTANRSNIGRGLASTGSPIAGVRNALMFDDRLQGKRNSLLNTLTSIGQIAPNLRTSAFNYGAATGRAGTGVGADQSASAFQSAAGSNLGQTANQLQSSGTQLDITRTQANANAIPGWERVVGALPDY